RRLRRKKPFCCFPMGSTRCGLLMTQTKRDRRCSRHYRQKKVMLNAERFAYTATQDGPGAVGLMPKLPITLSLQRLSTTASGLLDTGATVNVLPYQVGIEIGAEWKDEAATIRLTGNLAQFKACPIVVHA